MTTSRLLNLLRDIGSDAKLHRMYETDCEALMDRYELGSDEREALRRCDLDQIKSLTGTSDVRMTKTNIEVYD